MKSVVFTLFVATCAVLLPLVTYAADYVVMPLALNLDVAKRDIVRETITLRNESDRQVRLYASVHEVSTDRDGVLESFTSPAMSDRTVTPTSWVEITRGRIVLPPGETRDIPLTIRMNPNTQPGSYSVFIGFGAASNQPLAEQQVMAGDAPGTLINLTVDKEQNQFLRLARFITDRFVTASEDAVATYRLMNPGAVDVAHSGELIVYDARGAEVASVDLNPAGDRLAPDESTNFSTALPADLPWGKYKAFLTVEYGDHMSASLNDTAFFFVLPWWQLLVLFMIVLIMALLITVWLHKRQYRESEHDAPSLPLHVYDGESEAQDHDINLRT